MYKWSLFKRVGAFFISRITNINKSLNTCKVFFPAHTLQSLCCCNSFSLLGCFVVCMDVLPSFSFLTSLHLYLCPLHLSLFSILRPLEVIGVAELVNKMNGPWFNRFDEDLATAFSIYCGISIAHVSFFFHWKNKFPL